MENTTEQKKTHFGFKILEKKVEEKTSTEGSYDFRSFFIVIAFCVIAFFVIHKNTNNNVLNIKSVNIALQNIKVDLAVTPAEQEQGLSGRESIKPDEGMLFVFNNPGSYAFWMKDMNFPIDMIWLAQSEGGDESDMRVVYIKENADPKLYPETYVSKEDAKYVLEVYSGFAEKNNLKEGDIVKFEY